MPAGKGVEGGGEGRKSKKKREESKRSVKVENKEIVVLHKLELKF